MIVIGSNVPSSAIDVGVVGQVANRDGVACTKDKTAFIEGLCCRCGGNQSEDGSDRSELQGDEHGEEVINVREGVSWFVE
jgi:hypothetical protein